MITSSDGAEGGEPSYSLNRLVAVLGAVVLIGGSAALLRWSDSLVLTCVAIAAGVVVFAAVGVLVKRRAEDLAGTPGLD